MSLAIPEGFQDASRRGPREQRSVLVVHEQRNEDQQHPRILKGNGYKWQSGLFTLSATMIMLALSALAILCLATIVNDQYRLIQATYNYEQAQQAVEAGLEYGQAYLISNAKTITSGTFPTTAMSGTIANSLSQTISYTVNYSQPYPLIQPKLLQINATGQSIDGSATAKMSRQVYISTSSNPLLASSIVSQGNVSLAGNGSVVSTDSTTTINSGGTVSFAGNASTTSTSGSSSRNHTGTDVTQNNTSLSGITGAALFQSVFGETEAQMQANANVVLSGGSSVSGNSAGLYAGKIVWVNGSFSISGNASVGTPISPTILIVNGNFSVTGNGTFYGVVYVANVTSGGTTTVSNVQYAGNGTVSGATVTEGTVTVTGNGGSHNNAVISTLGLTTTTAGSLLGSWIDY